MATQLRFEKVTALPSTLVKNTMYLLSSGTDEFEVHISNADGTAARKIKNPTEVLKQTIAFSDTAPDITSISPFWWDTSAGGLFVKYNDGESVFWVEAVPSQTIPEFAGTGSANTMARSDHWHTELTIEANW